MGILFNTSTWRAPLLMIDSWLPPRTETPVRRTQTPALQRFVRAGWLGRCAPSRTERPAPPAERARAYLAASRTSSAVPLGTDNRVVISGRMQDVCAELDRLVALEQAQRAPGV